MKEFLGDLLRVEWLKLFEENMDLPIKALYSIKLATFCEYEDALQCGYIGLWRAAKAYDPTIAQFNTFAYYKIKQELYHYLRSEYKLRGKNKHNGKKLWDYTYFTVEDNMEFLAREEDFTEEIENKIIVNDILKTLTYNQGMLLRKYYGLGLKPMKIKDLAAERGVSHTWISMELKELRKLIKIRFRRYMR